MMQSQKSMIGSVYKDIERYVATPDMATPGVVTPDMAAPGVAHDKRQLDKNFEPKYVQKIDLGSGACIMDIHDFSAQYPCIARTTFDADMHKKKLHNYAQREHTHEEFFPDGLLEENRACMACQYNRRYVVYVPAGVVLDYEIDLNVVGLYAGACLREQVIIIFGSGASATIYDYASSVLNNAQVITRSVSCWIQNSAHLTYMYDQRYSAGVTAFTTIVGYAHTNSTVDMYGLIIGADFSKTVFDVQAVADGANITVRGLYALSGAQRAQIVSYQNHESPGSSSNTTIKGLLAESSSAIFHGTIFIDKNAPNTCAIQENKNLLLSSDARAHSIPILQALNNEVQCAHGSAVGQLDAEQLFYAHARGLNQKAATQLLLQGFIADVLPAKYRENMMECVLNKFALI